MYGDISHDGRNIIAMEQATHTLFLYNLESRTTRRVTELGDYPRWSRDGEYVYFDNYYFNEKGRSGGIQRWNLKTNTFETLLKYPDFLLTGTYGVNFSIAPDNSIVLLKDTTNRDLYALDLDLP